MALSADMHARIYGPRPLSQLFVPYGSSDKITLGNLLPTLPASIEPHVTSAFQKLGWVDGEPDAGAGRGARGAGGDRGHAMGGARELRRSGGAHAGPAAPTTSNPIYGGLLAQNMYADAGRTLPVYVEPAGGAAAYADDAAAHADDAASYADEAADVAAGAQHQAAAAGGAAATAGGPATAAERSMMASFEQLSTLPEQQRIDVLSGALEHRFAAGKGPSTLEVLTRAIIDGPFDDSAPAMQSSLERVLAGGAADVAAATAKAAPAAAEAAGSVAHAAPVAAEAAASVAHAAPVAAEVITHAAPAAAAPLRHSAPAAAEALAHAAPAIAEATGHAAPAAAAALDHAAPLLDDALDGARALLRGGGTTRLYGMEDGIMQALKLLRR